MLEGEHAAVNWSTGCSLRVNHFFSHNNAFDERFQLMASSKAVHSALYALLRKVSLAALPPPYTAPVAHYIPKTILSFIIKQQQGCR